MGCLAALSAVDEGNANGPSRYVTDRKLRGRRVERVGFGLEAERHLGVVICGAGDCGRQT